MPTTLVEFFNALFDKDFRSCYVNTSRYIVAGLRPLPHRWGCCPGSSCSSLVLRNKQLDEDGAVSCSAMCSCLNSVWAFAGYRVLLCVISPGPLRRWDRRAVECQAVCAGVCCVCSSECLRRGVGCRRL